jgi:hypothetical protein
MSRAPNQQRPTNDSDQFAPTSLSAAAAMPTLGTLLRRRATHRSTMGKIRHIAIGLMLFGLCLTRVVGQDRARYPQNAGDVIASVEALGRVDFSVQDAIKRFGAIKHANGDDKFDVKDGSFLLTPLPSNGMVVKKVVLDIFESKPNRVNIEYLKPVLISYGTLKEKYGAPKYLQPPVVKCAKGIDCRPRFVGYSFSFVPAEGNAISGKRVEVVVDLGMQWSKEVPQHTDKDFLVVEAIRFRRVWRDQED